MGRSERTAGTDSALQRWCSVSAALILGTVASTMEAFRARRAEQQQLLSRIEADTERQKAEDALRQTADARTEARTALKAFNFSEANRLIEAYTKEGKNLSYVDVFTPMLDSQGKARPELFGPDKLHMNATGYELWKGIIAPLLK